MISNMWNNTEFFCSEHRDQPLSLESNSSHSTFDYCCHQCSLKVPSIKIEKIMDKMSDEIVNAEFDNNTVLNITGKKYSVGEYVAVVLEHDHSGKFKVAVSDKKMKK